MKTPGGLEETKQEFFKKNKKIFYGFIIILVVFITGIWIISNRIEQQRIEKEEQRIEAENRAKIEQAISDMVAKYNAVTNWTDVFDKKEFWEKTYVIQFQNAILFTNGRPILFYASINDIWKEGDQYYVRFEDFLRDIYFEIKCSEKQAKRLSEHPGTYAVIAQIEQIYKKEFPDIYTKGADFDIVINDIFVATGNCLDFLHKDDLFL